METPISLEAARSFNTVGAATLIIPDYIDRRSLRKNTRMRLWRRGLDGTTRSFGDTEWFLRKIRHSYNDQTYTLEFEDALSLLAFRLVAYTSETPYADKTLEEFGLIVPDDSLRIDNMMRAYVRENYGALALDANRINSLISIEEDKNLGPYGDQKASWKLLSDTLSGLANMSAEKGLELFYDFVPQPDGTFMFKVWDKIRNVDRGSDSFSILTLSEELNHLTEVEEIEDYSEIGTYAYVLGYDSGPSQIIVERSNDLEIANDPFGRIEFTEEAPDIDVDRVLENIGDAALRGKRPKRTVSARVVEGTGIVYGRDYNYGDRVMIHVGTRKYNCHVKAVRTRWAEGQEDLEVRLDGYEEDAFPTFPNIPAEDENLAPLVDAGPDQNVDETEPEAPNFGLVEGQEIIAGIDADGGIIFRTADFLDPSPTWEEMAYLYADDDEIGTAFNFVVDPFSPLYRGVLVEDAERPLPIFGVYEVGPDDYELGEPSNTGSAGVFAQESEGNPNPSMNKFLQIYPPANAVRVVVQGSWVATYTKTGGSVGGILNMWENSVDGLSRNSDFVFTAPAANETASGSWTAEYFLDVPEGDWIGNREDAEATPLVREEPSISYEMYVNSAGPLVTTTIDTAIRVKEIEMDDGTIYTPVLAGSVNGWVVDRHRVWRISDIFGDEPRADKQYSFVDSAEQEADDAQQRIIAASFGRFEEAESDNPWLMVLSVYDNAADGVRPYDGWRIVYSRDAGLTWSDEILVTPFHKTGAGDVSGLTNLSLWLSPRIPGLAFLMAAQATAAHPVAMMCYQTQDWGETWTSLSSPAVDEVNGWGGTIHVPWEDNDDQAIVYHGAFTHNAPSLWRLKRVEGAVVTDVSPVTGGRTYGAFRGLFGIRAHDLNRQRVLACVSTGHTTSDPSQEYYAVFISDDAGDTWTLVEGPEEAADFYAWGGWEAAFAGDNMDIVYIWGGAPGEDSKVISYSDDFGASVDDKSGNLDATYYTANSRPTGFVGIVGGTA